MSSNFGKKLKISLFGESHSSGVGVVIDGLPSGLKIDEEKVLSFLARRAPGKDKTATQRNETDTPKIMSGIFNGFTTGTPICAVFENNDIHSKDYDKLKTTARPGHADYTGFIKYNGFNDYRGGGHFSGRITLGLSFAGALCMQYLETRGIIVAAHIASVKDENDQMFDSVNVTSDDLKTLLGKKFPVINDETEKKIREIIESARMNMDSVGGIIECAAVGLPAGIGAPIFDNVESVLSSIIFAIPAVKGVEFGAGFNSAKLFGSENNDEFYMLGDEIKTKTNNHGGILGGITSSMPLIVRAAFKPTPSIAKEQNTVDFINKTNTTLSVTGRHDPCILLRAVPVIEAAVAIGLTDLML